MSLNFFLGFNNSLFLVARVTQSIKPLAGLGCSLVVEHVLSKYKPQASAGMLEDAASYTSPSVPGKLLVYWRHHVRHVVGNHDQTIPEAGLPGAGWGAQSPFWDKTCLSELSSSVLESDLVGIHHRGWQRVQLSPVVSGLR